MATVPAHEEPREPARIWATYPDAGRAARAARALETGGVEKGRIRIASDPGTSEGPIAREREHREGVRIVRRLGAGAVVGASLGALVGVVVGLVSGSRGTGLALFTVAGMLFLGGVGAFVAGLGSLRSAAPDHRKAGDEAPGGVAVEVRSQGRDPDVIEVLRRHGPTTLVMTDELGRPLRDADAH